MKQILRYDAKKQNLHLIMPELKNKTLKLLDLVNQMFPSKDFDEKEAEKDVEKATHKTIHLMPGDTFDLEYGYALLFLEFTCGSKRKRSSFLKERYGDLLTAETERLLTITAAMELSAETDTYNEYKEYVKSILQD